MYAARVKVAAKTLHLAFRQRHVANLDGVEERIFSDFGVGEPDGIFELVRIEVGEAPQPHEELPVRFGKVNAPASEVAKPVIAGVRGPREVELPRARRGLRDEIVFLSRPERVGKGQDRGLGSGRRRFRENPVLRLGEDLADGNSGGRGQSQGQRRKRDPSVRQVVRFALHNTLPATTPRGLGRARLAGSQRLRASIFNSTSIIRHGSLEPRTFTTGRGLVSRALSPRIGALRKAGGPNP